MDIGARVQTTCNPVKIALVLVSGVFEEGHLVSTNYIENFRVRYTLVRRFPSPLKTKQRQLNNSFLYSTSKLRTYRPIANDKHCARTFSSGIICSSKPQVFFKRRVRKVFPLITNNVNENFPSKRVIFYLKGVSL